MIGLRKRLEAGVAGKFRYQHEMFLDIFEKLWDRWESRLQKERYIDFEDMLNLAADCLEQGRWDMVPSLGVPTTLVARIPRKHPPKFENRAAAIVGAINSDCDSAVISSV